MKKIIIGIVILAILLVIGLVALPSLVPSSVYKDKIESQLTEELGRDVRVVGDIKLSAFPVIKANAGRVEIDNPCLLYTSPSPRDATLSRMPSSA